MRLKNLIYYSFALLLLGGSFGCEQDDLPDLTEPVICPSVVYPENARLLRSYYGQQDENGNTLLEEYHYGENGKISRVTTPYYENGKLNGTLRYDAYSYDSNDQLTAIVSYSRNKRGNFEKYLLIRYTYTPEGLKESEVHESFPVGMTSLKRFYYNEGKTDRCEWYEEGKLTYSILYEYDENGNLAREVTYRDEKPVSYILHTYEKAGENIVKEKMVEYNVGEIDVPQREMEKVYDLQNNLLYFSSRELRLESSRSSYTICYEYQP